MGCHPCQLTNSIIFQDGHIAPPTSYSPYYPLSNGQITMLSMGKSTISMVKTWLLHHQPVIYPNMFLFHGMDRWTSQQYPSKAAGAKSNTWKSEALLTTLKILRGETGEPGKTASIISIW
jgi:hypothetical protein